jgi:Flp pilus assembly protein TadD/SAM-dependent methyltransferase
MPEQNTLTIEQALDLAIQHHSAGDLPVAEAIYQQILQAAPNHPDALHLLGVIAHQAGENHIAIDLITKAIGIRHDHAEAHSNLGLAFQAVGRLDEAIASHRKALTINANSPEAHNNLGYAFQDSGRFNEAVASFHKALAINPDYAEAHNNLGYALRELGKLEEAFACHRRSIILEPENDQFWRGLATSLENLSFNCVDDDLWHVMLQLLEQPTVPPLIVTRPIIRALRHHPDFSQIFLLVVSSEPDEGFDFVDVAEKLSKNLLFLRILGLSQINDPEIERMLTIMRRAMIMEAVSGNGDGKGMPFSIALALQCFANDYIYPETAEEKANVEELQQRIAVLVEEKRKIPASFISALGAYRPLHVFPWARELSEREWPGDIKELIERQISEPLEELSLRSQIPCLSPIQDMVSQTVRQQYEENPYPRWIKAGIKEEGRTVGAVLQGAPHRFSLRDYVSPESPEILVAGCGTGRQALGTACKFSNSRVLAVDLSQSSLSYALRKTNELGLPNIEYAQADIMELGKLERRFDLVESVGVLHHLAEPLAGWRVLVDLLRPGGLMRIALYSEIARQGIVEARSLIAEKRYTASPEDIRQCRRDLMAIAESDNQKIKKILGYSDFYNLSECRDLLFHVQEHRFTLPQIADALGSLNLTFLGFELKGQRTLAAFKAAYPKKDAHLSLNHWHEFELKNPDTFIGMYQFWCQKR